MGQLAVELAALSEALEQFQHDLSDMLLAADVSPALMRRVQTIDGATQSLHALSGVARKLACATSRGSDTVESGDLERLVPLGGLLCRLTGAEAWAAEPTEDGHVSLF